MKRYLMIPVCVLVVFGVGFGCKSFSQLLNRSGTEYVVQIDTDESDKDAICEQAIKNIASKINQSRMVADVKKDPDNKNRIIVRIYGTNDPDRAREILLTNHQLELRKAISYPNPNPIQTYPSVAAAKQVVTDGQEVLPYLDRNDSTSQYVIVETKSIVTGNDLRDATAISNGSGGYMIAFSLQPKGAVAFGEWTGKNIGNYLVVVLDKKVQSAAYIKSQIFDSGEISGRFSKQQAEDIVMSLKSGYLPATMKIVDEKQFGN